MIDWTTQVMLVSVLYSPAHTGDGDSCPTHLSFDGRISGHHVIPLDWSWCRFNCGCCLTFHFRFLVILFIDRRWRSRRRHWLNPDDCLANTWRASVRQSDPHVSLHHARAYSTIVYIRYVALSFDRYVTLLGISRDYCQKWCCNYELTSAINRR